MYKIFQPAIFFMNQLSYKAKIFILAFIPILLFAYPTYGVFNTIILQKNHYIVQHQGLEYYKRFYTLIESLTKYHPILDKKNSSKEDNIDMLFEELSNYDSENFNMIFNKLNLLKNNFNLLKNSRDSNDASEKSIELITGLIEIFKDISSKTYFDRSKDQYLHQLSMLLHKQISLMNILHEVQFLGDKIFSKAYLLPSEKVAFTKIYMQLQDLLKGYSLKIGDDILSEQQYTLYTFMNILDDNIIKRYNNAYNQSLFNQKILVILDNQMELNAELLALYSDEITKISNNEKEKENMFILTFFSILLLCLYLYVSFYKAVTSSLAQLQNLSWSVARGDFKNREVLVETKDEVGDVFLAFNQMQKNLTKNIAFLNSYKMSIDQSSIVSKTDTRGIITYINKKFCDISGYSTDELMGRPHNIIRHPDVPKEAFADLWTTIKSGKIWHGIVKNRKKNGDYYIVDATVAPIFDENGEIEEYIAVRHDVTELEKSKDKLRKQKEDELHQQETDLLTQLPNRVRMIKDLKSIN